MNGKKFDVLIEDEAYVDQATGLKVFFGITVWADAGMKDVIAKVEGVTRVFCNDSPTQYLVFTDKRYDVEYIKREIEAAILCAG